MLRARSPSKRAGSTPRPCGNDSTSFFPITPRPTSSWRVISTVTTISHRCIRTWRPLASMTSSVRRAARQRLPQPPSSRSTIYGMNCRPQNANPTTTKDRGARSCRTWSPPDSTTTTASNMSTTRSKSWWSMASMSTRRCNCRAAGQMPVRAAEQATIFRWRPAFVWWPRMTKSAARKSPTRGGRMVRPSPCASVTRRSSPVTLPISLAVSPKIPRATSASSSG